MRRGSLVFLPFDQVPIGKLIFHGFLTSFKLVKALAQGKNDLVQFRKKFVLVGYLAFKFS